MYRHTTSQKFGHTCDAFDPSSLFSTLQIHREDINYMSKRDGIMQLFSQLLNKKMFHMKVIWFFWESNLENIFE